MISTLATAALPADANNRAFPAAAALTADPPPAMDGLPIPFAQLLGLALDAVPAAGASAASTEGVQQDNAADSPATAPIAVEMLIPFSAPLATVAAPVVVAPPVATSSAAAPAVATPAVEAKTPGGAAATTDASPAANDAVVARNPLPGHAAPESQNVPAPSTLAEPTVERDTNPDVAALPAVPVPAKADVVSAPDAPATPSAVSGATAANAAEPPAFHARVATPVNAPEFPREFAGQVHIAVQRGFEHASIAVHPPELGPVEVRLEISNGEARVHFAAESAATREAISDAMPKLRDMLGSQGLTLSGSTVGAELPQREQPGAPRERGGTPQARDAADTANDASTATATSTLRLVDVFA